MSPTPPDRPDRDPFDLDDDPGFRPEEDTVSLRPSRLWLALPLLLIAVLIGLGPDLAEKSDDTTAGAEDQGQVVPFQMLPSNHMVVRAKLNGEGPFRLIFDLGSPVTLLGNRAAVASGAIPEDAPKSFLFGVRGEGMLETLAMGDLTAEDVPVVVMDHPALKALGGMLGRPLDGIVGHTFFARYRTTIDYQRHEMTFTPVDHEVRDLLADLPQRMMGPKVARTRILAPQGIWGFQVGEPTGGLSARGVPITAVSPGSPAAQAGLKVGDVLTSLDGRWTVSVADTFAAAADVAPGQEAVAVLLRDGSEIERTIRPREGL